jgi:hypothetical protein
MLTTNEKGRMEEKTEKKQKAYKERKEKGRKD